MFEQHRQVDTRERVEYRRLCRSGLPGVRLEVGHERVEQIRAAVRVEPEQPPERRRAGPPDSRRGVTESRDQLLRVDRPGVTVHRRGHDVCCDVAGLLAVGRHRVDGLFEPLSVGGGLLTRHRERGGERGAVVPVRR